MSPSSSATPSSSKFLVAALIAAITFIINPIHLMAQSSNLEKGQAFLKENASKPGVHTTPSGLQYKIITEGTGKRPAVTDTVLVNYRGTTIDGVEFDSSYKRNDPISFPLNGVIPGWTEGVQLIKEGGKIQLFIPSNLAYGPKGAGGVIPPDATLLFDVELIKVN